MGRIANDLKPTDSRKAVSWSSAWSNAVEQTEMPEGVERSLCEVLEQIEKDALDSLPTDQRESLSELHKSVDAFANKWVLDFILRIQQSAQETPSRLIDELKAMVVDLSQVRCYEYEAASVLRQIIPYLAALERESTSQKV